MSQKVGIILLMLCIHISLCEAGAQEETENNRWIPIGYENDVFIDSLTIRKFKDNDGLYADVWIKHNIDGTEILFHKIVDLSRMREKIIGMVGEKDGKREDFTPLFNKGEPLHESEWDYIIPGSKGETMYRTIKNIIDEIDKANQSSKQKPKQNNDSVRVLVLILICLLCCALYLYKQKYEEVELLKKEKHE